MFALAGLITQPGFDIPTLFSSMGEGTKGMFETIIVAVLVAALGELSKENGGFEYILGKIRKRAKGKRGGQAGIAALASAIDIATGNNTVAIVMAAPIAREISREYGVSPQKTASLLDIFTCIWQGIIPYGAQMLIAVGLAGAYGVSAFDIIYFCCLSAEWGYPDSGAFPPKKKGRRGVRVISFSCGLRCFCMWNPL